jgi:hypothetical protein
MDFSNTPYEVSGPQTTTFNSLQSNVQVAVNTLSNLFNLSSQEKENSSVSELYEAQVRSPKEQDEKSYVSIPVDLSNPGREFTLKSSDGIERTFIRYNQHDINNSNGTIGLVEITRANGDTEYMLSQALEEDLPDPVGNEDKENDVDNIDFGFENINVSELFLDDGDRNEFDDDAVIRE